MFYVHNAAVIRTYQIDAPHPLPLRTNLFAWIFLGNEILLLFHVVCIKTASSHKSLLKVRR